MEEIEREEGRNERTWNGHVTRKGRFGDRNGGGDRGARGRPGRGGK